MVGTFNNISGEFESPAHRSLRSSATALNVLIIDDAEPDYCLLREWLEEVPGHLYTTHWCSTYETGLAQAVEKKYDAILVDYRLGARSGLQLIKQITSEQPLVPIVMLTGMDNSKIDHESMIAGATDFVLKDQLDAWRLDRVIRHTIDRTRYAQQQVELGQTQAIVAAVATANHKLNSPLTSLMGNVSLLKKQLQAQGDESQVERIDQIQKDAHALSVILKELRKLSKAKIGSYADGSPILDYEH